MKIAEVRALLGKYSREQLEQIVAEMYKSIPKKVKTDKDIDGILTNPGGAARRKKAEKSLPDIAEMQMDIDTFIEDARESRYCSPNNVVPKKERSKWRFKVKRWYKDLQSLAANREHTEKAAQLLEKLYGLLCYACDYTTFTAYDPFESIGITQSEFFRTILAVKRRFQGTKAFSEEAVALIVSKSLNRYTLKEELMRVALEFMETPDSIQLTIDACEEGLEEEKANPTPPENSWSDSDFTSKRIMNDYTEMALRCHSALKSIDRGIELFQNHYRHWDPEVKLYKLTRILAECGQPEVFLREYDKAKKAGVKPRKRLVDLHKTVKESGEFPSC